MKLSYKQRLFLYFFIVFGLFTVGVVVIEQSQERKFKTEALEERLNAYCELTNVEIARNEDLDSLVQLFPHNVRLTVIDTQGRVQYDNSIKNLAGLENHLQRGEIMQALASGSGSEIRVSSSNNKKYLYFAKKYANRYVRAALPYDIETQKFLESKSQFVVYIIALFLIGLILMDVISKRFAKSINQLRDFVMLSDAGSPIPDDMKFANDELGEIGTKITESYKLLEISRQQMLSEREKLLQHVHSSEEGLCFFDANRRVEFYNGLFIQYLNIIIDDASSNSESIFEAPQFKAVNGFLESRTDDFFETLVQSQGRRYSVRVNVFDDNGFEIIINDITASERTRLLKQEMTSNIAHELRTPVTSIRGYLETVLSSQLDEQQSARFLQQAFNQTVVLSELIGDMSMLTSIEEAPQNFAIESVNVVEVLENVWADMAPLMNERQMTMRWSIDNDLRVEANENLIYSVFRNLTENAIRYAGSGVVIEVSKYAEDDDFYYFSYADNGVGIADESHLNRLFERFYRISNGRTRDTGGSGLGLSIVKNAITLHHGTISVKNRVQGGLEFLFTMPRARVRS